MIRTIGISLKPVTVVLEHQANMPRVHTGRGSQLRRLRRGGFGFQFAPVNPGFGGSSVPSHAEGASYKGDLSR
jgi:hypothetical protein